MNHFCYNNKDVDELHVLFKRIQDPKKINLNKKIINIIDAKDEKNVIMIFI